jgi:N-acetylneuraminate synthase
LPRFTDTITLEEALPIEEHARQVMEWRNDPGTLAMSFHTELKRWPQFAAEFREAYFVWPHLAPLFALARGERVAFLRFEPARDARGERRTCVELSVNVAPGHRGRGVGTAVLGAARRHLAARGIEAALAFVKPANAASLAAFRNAGFTSRGERDAHRPGMDAPVRVIELVADLVTTLVLPGGRTIGPGHDCFVIAEAGSNWRMGSSKRDRAMAFALIDAAAEAGADAVKFQTYRPETVYAEGAGESAYLAEAGILEPIRDIFADLAMPYAMIPELAGHCASRGILFMSTPFSIADLEALDPYVAIHKIASYEISHLRLIERVARTRKPVLLSTGASSLADIAWAAATLREAGGGPLALMQCTARYPAPVGSLELGTIPVLKRTFAVPVGLSDHSRHPTLGPVMAVALGASVIEKHFTLANRLPGPDHAFAVTAGELADLVAAVRDAGSVVGTGVKDVQPIEQELFRFARRCVQATRPIAQGETIEEDVNAAILRPGQQRPGMHPRHLPQLAGRRARRAIPAGDGIREEDVE